MKHSATIKRQPKQVKVGEYATVTDCGDYFRVQWHEDGAITTTGKMEGRNTMAETVSWVKYLLRA